MARWSRPARRRRFSPIRPATTPAPCSPPPSGWKRRRRTWWRNRTAAVSDDEKSAKPLLADLPAEAFYAKATVAAPQPIAAGFREYARFQLALVKEDGSTTVETRDILHVGKVAAVLPVDPARGE